MGRKSQMLSAVKMELNKFRVSCNSRQLGSQLRTSLTTFFHHKQKFLKFVCLKRQQCSSTDAQKKKKKKRMEPQDLAGNYKISLNEIHLPPSKPSCETWEQCFSLICIK